LLVALERGRPLYPIKKDAASAAQRLAASEVEGSALFGEAAFLAAEFISAVQGEFGFRDLDRCSVV